MSDLPDILDDPTKLDDEKAQLPCAKITADGGITRIVCETPAETAEDQAEQAAWELEQAYPEAEIEVEYFYK